MARTEPDYDFFAQPSAAAPGTAHARRPAPSTRNLQPLGGAADLAGPPEVPADRMSAPPPNVPPVFERRTQPRGEDRSWHPPTAVEGRSAPEVTLPEVTAPAWTATAQPFEALPTSAEPPGAVPASLSGSPRPTSTEVTLGRPARRRPGRVAVASLLAVLLAGAAGYGATVGVPRYLEHADRVVWEQTSLQLPRTVAGMPRVSIAEDAAPATAARTGLFGTGSTAGQLTSRLAVYGGSTGPRVVVVVGRPQSPLDADERDLVRTAFTRAVAASDVVLTERDPGDLGGWLGCGIHDGRTTMCLAVDAGAVVSITVTATGSSALTLARDTRAAIERRASQPSPASGA